MSNAIAHVPRCPPASAYYYLCVKTKLRCVIMTGLRIISAVRYIPVKDGSFGPDDVFVLMTVAAVPELSLLSIFFKKTFLQFRYIYSN